MKKAFTMLELIFVIVIVGILSFIAASSFQRNTLREAADQLVSHIRYTQHLAMMDDKFDPNENDWYKRRWQIVFYPNITHTLKCVNDNLPNAWAYSIFSENPGFTGNPDISELARNPLATNQFLSGGFNNILCIDNSQNNPNEHSMEELRLGSKFGITNIGMTASCNTGGPNPSQRIAFDYLGRPLRGAFHNYTSSYPANRLIVQDCNITLSNATNNIVITITPETGYTYISSQN